MRSHDQYNTTIYGLDDRYRGIKGGRKVILVNAEDITALGFRDGDLVDIGVRVDNTRRHTRRASGHGIPQRLLRHPARQRCGVLYPETNPLVPLEHVAAKSNTPVSKAVTVRLEASGA